MDDHREKYLAQAAAKAHKAIDKLMTDKTASPGPCRECRHYGGQAHYSLGEGFVGRCLNPIIAPPKFDPETDNTLQPNESCSRQRRDGSLCGPDGRLFQSKDAVKSYSFWASLFGRR